MRAMVSTTAAFFSLDSPNASRLKEAIRTVGNWFWPVVRVACVLLDTVGQAGEDLEPEARGDVSCEISLERKCSVSDELETSRLDSKPDFGPRVPVGLGSIGWLGEVLKDVAKFDCSLCQTTSVESWKAMAKPPRIPAMTT